MATPLFVLFYEMVYKWLKNSLSTFKKWKLHPLISHAYNAQFISVTSFRTPTNKAYHVMSSIWKRPSLKRKWICHLSIFDPRKFLNFYKGTCTISSMLTNPSQKYIFDYNSPSQKATIGGWSLKIRISSVHISCI